MLTRAPKGGKQRFGKAARVFRPGRRPVSCRRQLADNEDVFAGTLPAYRRRVSSSILAKWTCEAIGQKKTLDRGRAGQ
jgi:hypothetical protein